jgi:hypothetical protein
MVGGMSSSSPIKSRSSLVGAVDAHLVRVVDRVNVKGGGGVAGFGRGIRVAPDYLFD